MRRGTLLETKPAFELLINTETLPLLTSRGCPFKCSFCAASLLCSTFEQRNIASVIEEVESCYQRFRTRNIAFYDDSLLLNKEHHVIPILKGIAEKNLPLSFHSQSREG